MKHAAFAVVLAFVSTAGNSLAAATKPLTIAVSNETAPSGGSVQIKFFAGHPQQISSGELSIDLDPGFFTSIRSVAVFSTAGDAYGFASVTGLHADVHFGSLTGGIGQSSGLPILTVTASVGAQAHSAIVSADPAGSAWRDPAGNVYAVTATPGAMTAGGSLSISDVVPGGGILSAGTPIQISGTGFGASTIVEIDAASVASVQVLGPQQIQLMLGAPTELTGKRIHVRNPDGSEADYFPSLPSSPVTGAPAAPLTGLFPILPLERYRAAITSQPSDRDVVVVALQNPNPAAVDVLIHSLLANSQPVTSTIPPNGWIFLSPRLGESPFGNNVLASAPIRMVQLAVVELAGAPSGTSLPVFASPVTATNAPPLQVSPALAGVPPLSPGTVGGGDTVMWTWQAGTAAPPPQYISVYGDSNEAEEPAAYTVSVATESGGPWLSVSQTSGTSCSGSSPCPTIAVIANTAALAPGNYRATITFTPVGTSVRPEVLPSTIGVGLTVTAGKPVSSGPAPLLVASPPTLSWVNSSGTQLCASSSENIPLDLTTQISTSDGGNWLTTVYGSTTTPSCPNVMANAAGLLPGTYRGSIVFTGGGQTVTVPVSLTVSPPADQPLLGTIVNAASGISGSIAPGEIVTIHGLGLGPTTPASLTIDAQGQLATKLSETSLLIGGIPAPLLYVSQSQINAIVPYEIAGRQLVTVQALSGGASSPVWGIPVAATIPGIFATDSSGQGPGAILNQDNSVNTPSNPAAVGSVIQIYATGEGQTNPPGKTGSIASGENLPVLPVSVSIGGINAPVTYAGTAPTSVEGLFQINAIVPAGTTPGAALPVQVTVGSTESQLGVTITVK